MLNLHQAQRELAPLLNAPCRLVIRGGGITGETGQVRAGPDVYFFKWMPDGDALDAEHDGLALLATGIRVPAVVYRGPLAGGQVLVLEWLDLTPPGEGAGEALGKALKHLHGLGGERFGYHRDNWIGASRQFNEPKDDWAAFFVDRRLAPQLEWARERALPTRVVADLEAVMARVPGWLSAIDVTPSPVHGDLWRGNVGWLAEATPVLFDPAVYYGHGEVDLAMLGLFGGTPEGLYRGYGCDPSDPAFRQRARLYNLYHLLNHFTLFGGGYQTAVADQVAALLSA